jgi:nicotinamidase-related amidase
MTTLSITEVEQFLLYVDDWLNGLAAIKFDDLAREAGGAENVVVMCVDLTNAFAKFGNLASPRVDAIVQPVVRLFKLAYERGARTFILPQDCHPPEAPEFEQYGPHAMCDSPEAETVPELKQLPFAGIFNVLPKTSINPGLNAGFAACLERNGTPPVTIVTGDCTDICVYQLAMHVKVRANERLEKCMVVVPRDCVDTYDVTVDAGRERGIVPHPGELMHRIFLYHMMLNGVRVVREIK